MQNPVASSTAPYPQELNPWSSGISEPIHSSTAEKNENQTPVQDQRCQSGPSAKNSVIPSEEDSLKNYGGRPTTTADFRSSIRQIPFTSNDCQAEIRKHDFQADYDRRSLQKLNEMIESQKGEIYRAHQGDERLRRDQQLLHEQLLEQNRDLREAHEKSLSEMEELKGFQGSTFDTIARRNLVEDRDAILELTGKIQELQNEINCVNDSRDFQDAESVRSGQSHVTSQPVSFPPHPIPGGMLSRSVGMPSRNDGPPSIWDTLGILGNVFANPVASSSAPYPQELNPWSSYVSKTHITTYDE